VLRVTKPMRPAARAGDGTHRALLLIWGARGATGGHRYLLAKDGLTLVASEAPGPPPDDLFQFITDYLAKELQEPEIATAIVSAAIDTHADVPATWTDACGVVHQPLLLTCALGGVVLCAGVAVLRVQDSIARHQRSSAEIITATAAQLIEAGDAHGTPARF
jgi:hypothetical protein